MRSVLLALTLASTLSGCIRLSFDLCAQDPPHPDCGDAAIDASADAARPSDASADAARPSDASADAAAPSDASADAARPSDAG